MDRTKKQVIPCAEMLKKIQFLLVSYPECRNIHVDGIEVYKEQNDGANWHVTFFPRSGGDNDLLECKDKIISEIRNLRECYDVTDR